MFNKINYIPPKGDYSQFTDENHYEEKCREWGLAGKNVKRAFYYKSRNGEHVTNVTIDGYEVHDTYETLVIRFENDQLSCIHAGFLKEMQKGDFGKESMFEGKEAKSEGEKDTPVKTETKPATEKKEPKKEKAVPKPTITLPDEKVHFIAVVKELTTRYNHFADKEEEIIIYEEVRFGEEETNIGLAYSSVTKALAALNLEPGMVLTFDAKVVGNKKLNKEVVYKINNPSKISLSE